MDTAQQEFWQASKKVTLIGAALDALLGIVKIAVGSFSHSYSLVADGIHSLSDLFSDFMVLAITRFSRSSPDDDHPYGHARFETLATVLLGCILLAVAGALAFENLVRFTKHETLLVPTWPALIVAAASIASKEWIYRYTAKVAIQYQSDLLLANAWHSRSDALSSIVVFVGVAGAMLGIQWMDVVAALLVAAILAKIAIGFIWSNIRQLVDEGLPPETQTEIRTIANSVEGVVDVHDLRSRLMGSDVFIEIHVQVAPWISVSEGHFIGNRVVKKIKHEMPSIKDIVFHIDIEHEDQEGHDNNENLPSRNDILTLLKEAITDLAQLTELEKTRLHYVGDSVSIELYAPGTNELELTAAVKSASELCEQLDWLSDISFWK